MIDNFHFSTDRFGVNVMLPVLVILTERQFIKIHSDKKLSFLKDIWFLHVENFEWIRSYTNIKQICKLIKNLFRMFDIE